MDGQVLAAPVPPPEMGGFPGGFPYLRGPPPHFTGAVPHETESTPALQRSLLRTTRSPPPHITGDAAAHGGVCSRTRQERCPHERGFTPAPFEACPQAGRSPPPHFMRATTAPGGGCPQRAGRALHLTWSRLHIARGPAPDVPAQNPAGMRPGPGVPHSRTPARSQGHMRLARFADAPAGGKAPLPHGWAIRPPGHAPLHTGLPMVTLAAVTGFRFACTRRPLTWSMPAWCANTALPPAKESLLPPHPTGLPQWHSPKASGMCPAFHGRRKQA